MLTVSRIVGLWSRAVGKVLHRIINYLPVEWAVHLDCHIIRSPGSERDRFGPHRQPRGFRGRTGTPLSTLPPMDGCRTRRIAADELPPGLVRTLFRNPEKEKPPPNRLCKNSRSLGA